MLRKFSSSYRHCCPEISDNKDSHLIKFVRNDEYDISRSQLNGRLGHLRSYPNVHFVNNENITRDMLYDRKHIKRHKVGILVSNLKDCAFNRISSRWPPSLVPRWVERNDLKHVLPPPSTNFQAAAPASIHLPPQMTSQKSYSEVVKSTATGKHCDLDHDTVLNILKLYQLLRQPWR